MFIYLIHITLQKYVISFDTCVIFADMIEHTSILSSFISLLYTSFFPPLFIYLVLSNSFMRFLLTSRNIFSLTLDLFHLVHPLAYTNTFSINGHMCKCPRLRDRTRSIVGNEEMILDHYGGIECDLNEI